MKRLFRDYKLSKTERKKARRVLRILSSKEYFGDDSNLLQRLIAENTDTILREVDVMREWCKSKRKTFSVLRLNNWMKNSKKYAEERKKRDHVVSDELANDLRKVEEFKRKRYEQRKQQDRQSILEAERKQDPNGKPVM